jgi:hypothetical protein
MDLVGSAVDLVGLVGIGKWWKSGQSDVARSKSAARWLFETKTDGRLFQWLLFSDYLTSLELNIQQRILAGIASGAGETPKDINMQIL